MFLLYYFMLFFCLNFLLLIVMKLHFSRNFRKTSQVTIEHLAGDTIQQIASLLDIQSIIHLSHTCRTLYHGINTFLIWQHLCLKKSIISLVKAKARSYKDPDDKPTSSNINDDNINSINNVSGVCFPKLLFYLHRRYVRSFVCIHSTFHLTIPSTKAPATTGSRSSTPAISPCKQMKCSWECSCET